MTKNRKETHDMKNFEDVFETLLRAAITDDGENKRLVIRQYEKLCRVFVQMEELFGVIPEQKLHRVFAAGSVSVTIPEICLDKTRTQKLCEILEHCNTFEILPLTNGKVQANVTVPNVFEMIEEETEDK